MAFNIDLTGPYDFDGITQHDFHAALRLYYQDRYPLVTRLSTMPTSALQLVAVDDDWRPRKTTVTTTINSAVTTLVVGNAFRAEEGDVLEMDSGEQVLVTAVNTTTTNTLTVSRGYAGTSANAQNSTTTVYLVSNTRTGAEVDQTARTNIPAGTTTTPQTVQKPYQIGGSLEASSGSMSIPNGFPSIVGYQRWKAGQETLHDMESAIFYAQYVALAGDTTRPQMRGIKQRLTTNNVTSPTNASAYKPSDFERDFMTGPHGSGGAPNLLVLSNEYRQAFFIWGMALIQERVQNTVLGVNIEVFQCPTLSAMIVFDPMLRAYHGVSLTADEAWMAWKRPIFDKPRGSRGDATEGDVIGECCVMLNNEAHHAWVQGVTGFAKQS